MPRLVPWLAGAAGAAVASALTVRVLMLRRGGPLALAILVLVALTGLLATGEGIVIALTHVIPDHIVRLAADQRIRVVLRTTPGIGTRPGQILVDPVGPGEEVSILDFRLRLPFGWKLVETQARKGQVLHASRMEVPGSQEASIQVALLYLEGPDELLVPDAALFGGYVSEPEAFIARYRSSLAFYSDVYSALPSDLMWACGARAKETKALLWAKSRTHVPVKRLDAHDVHAFVGPMSGGRLWGQIFDGAGAYRGNLLFECRGSSQLQSSENILGQLLWNSWFDNEPARDG